MPRKPIIRAFFHEPTNTVSYIVADPATKQAAVIDPVLDYDPNSGEVDIQSVTAILRVAEEQDLAIRWTLETHAHADHLSGSPFVKSKTSASSEPWLREQTTLFCCLPTFCAGSQRNVPALPYSRAPLAPGARIRCCSARCAAARRSLSRRS